jgi:pimeloyl-ACP methyl ester carboxylesterase
MRRAADASASASLPPDLVAWQARGRRVRIFGRELFVVREGDGAPAPLLVLHGFPTSSFDMRAALPRLAAERPVIVHDHLGFGLSDKPARKPADHVGREAFSYSLLEQAEMALGLWRELGVTRGHLLGHDYGTSVVTELLALRERGLLPLEILSVTLCNGSVHRELAHLTLAQKALLHPQVGPLFARFSNPRVFAAQMRRIVGEPRSLDDRELASLYAGIEHDGGRLLLPAISSYLDERVRFRERWIGALTRLDVPTHVLWGRRDPIAVPAMAEQLAREIPGATLTWLDELGHYPMIEDAARWANAANAWLAGRP